MGTKGKLGTPLILLGYSKKATGNNRGTTGNKLDLIIN
nr:MAG TPA: hypothetical protein [Caudoviricetes sp.]